MMRKMAQLTDARETLEDIGLLKRCIANERAAREQLARACLPRVRKTVFLSTGKSPDAEDLVQTSMIRIFGALDRFRGDSKLTTWIDRITVNTVKEHYRRRPIVSLFPTLEHSTDSIAPASLGPEIRLEGKRLMNALAPHLGAIKPHKRMAVVLSSAYGYTVSEIAELTGCSTETAKKRLQHGRRELLARLRGDAYLYRVFMETNR